MTDCSRMEEQLSAYIDGELSAGEAMQLERHLAGCRDCAALLADLRRTKDLVGKVEEIEPPPLFTQKIMAGVRAEAEPPRGLIQKLFRPIHIKIPLEALAACLVAVLAVYIYNATGPETANVTAPVERPAPVPRDLTPAPERKAGTLPEGEKGQQTGPANSAENNGTGRERGFAPVPGEQSTVPPGGDEGRARALSKKEEAGPAAPGTTASGAGERKAERTETTKSSGAAPAASRPSAAPGIPSSEQEVTPSPSRAPERQADRLKKGGNAHQAGDLASAVPRYRLVVKTETGSIKTAAGKTETLLRKLGAGKITRDSRQGLEIIEAEITSRQLKTVLDTLNAIGKVEAAGTPQGLSEGPKPVRIEIRSDP